MCDKLYEILNDYNTFSRFDVYSELILLQCTPPRAKKDVKNPPNFLNILQCAPLPVLNKTGPDNNNLSHSPSDNQFLLIKNSSGSKQMFVFMFMTVTLTK